LNGEPYLKAGLHSSCAGLLHWAANEAAQGGDSRGGFAGDELLQAEHLLVTRLH